MDHPEALAHMGDHTVDLTEDHITAVLTEDPHIIKTLKPIFILSTV